MLYAVHACVCALMCVCVCPRVCACVRGDVLQADLADEVPISHTLLAVTIAYDILYPVLSPDERTSAAERMLKELKSLMGKSHVGWTTQYVHNHMPTILTSIFAASLVLRGYKEPAVREPLELARRTLERNVALMQHMTDGSFHEGVHYNLYATRSLFVYLHLAKRHLGVGHFEHPWLKEQLTYLLASSLPGYTGPCGVGDASEQWSYGPVAQLYFLDHFVLRNGKANWMAGRILKVLATAEQRRLYSYVQMAPYEFLWFNPNIQEQMPAPARYQQMVILADRGYVSYGGGTKAGSTFLSLKAGPILGRSLLATVTSKVQTQFPFLKGMRSVNPGHEHPDQGSLIFYPNGKPFITESFYAPKLSYLDNVWLFEAQSAIASRTYCAGGHLVGQLGSCVGKWLEYGVQVVRDKFSTIVDAAQRDGMVMMMSESATAYPSDLGISCNTRTLVLLDNSTLLAVDSIVLSAQSTVHRGNAFFHNLYESFKVADEAKQFASQDTGPGRIQWFLDHGKSSKATLGKSDIPTSKSHRGGFVYGHYLNVSLALTKGANNVIVWLMQADGSETLGTVTFLRKSAFAVELLVTVDRRSYTVSVVTNHSYLAHRYSWHGSGLLVHVVKDGQLSRFGDQLPEHSGSSDSSTVHRPADKAPSSDSRATPKSKDQEKLRIICIGININSGLALLYIMLPVMLLALARYAFFSPQQHIMLVGLMWVVMSAIALSTGGISTCQDPAAAGSKRRLVRSQYPDAIGSPAPGKVSRPSVLVAGLFLGAASRDAVQHMFRQSPDRVLITVAGADIAIGLQRHTEIWEDKASCPQQASFRSGFARMFQPSTMRFSESPQSRTIPRGDAREKLAKDPSALAIAADFEGGWLLKLDWFLGLHVTRKAIVVYDDPEKWVSNVLESGSLGVGRKASHIELVKQLLGANVEHCIAEDIDNPCSRKLTRWKQFVQLEISRSETPALHKILAAFWMMYMETALCVAERWGPQRLHIVHLGRFAHSAVQDAERVSRFLGLPFHPNVRNDLMLSTRSGLMQYKEMMTYLHGHSAAKVLTPQMRRDIKIMCKSVLTRVTAATDMEV